MAADCSGDVAGAIITTILICLVLFCGYIHFDRKYGWTDDIINTLWQKHSNTKSHQQANSETQMSALHDLGNDNDKNKNNDNMANMNANNSNRTQKQRYESLDAFSPTVAENDARQAIVIDIQNDDDDDGDDSNEKNEKNKKNKKNKNTTKNNNDSSNNENKKKNENTKEKLDLNMISSIATADIIGLSDTEMDTPIVNDNNSKASSNHFNAIGNDSTSNTNGNGASSVYTHGAIGALHKGKENNNNNNNNNRNGKSSGQMMASIIDDTTTKSSQNNNKNGNNNNNNNSTLKVSGKHNTQSSTDSTAGFIVLIDNLSNLGNNEDTSPISGMDKENSNGISSFTNKANSVNNHGHNNNTVSVSKGGAVSAMVPNTTKKRKRVKKPPKNKTKGIKGRSSTVGHHGDKEHSTTNTAMSTTSGIGNINQSKKSSVILARGRVPLYRMGSLNKSYLGVNGSARTTKASAAARNRRQRGVVGSANASTIEIIDENSAIVSSKSLHDNNVKNLNTINESPNPFDIDSQSTDDLAITRGRKRSQSDGHYLPPTAITTEAAAAAGGGATGAENGGKDGKASGQKSEKSEKRVMIETPKSKANKEHQMGKNRSNQSGGVQIELFELYSDKHGQILSPQSYHYAMQVSKQQAKLQRAKSNTKRMSKSRKENSVIGGTNSNHGIRIKKRKGKHRHAGTVGAKQGKKLRFMAMQVAPIVEEHESEIEFDSRSHNVDGSAPPPPTSMIQQFKPSTNTSIDNNKISNIVNSRNNNNNNNDNNNESNDDVNGSAIISPKSILSTGTTTGTTFFDGMSQQRQFSIDPPMLGGSNIEHSVQSVDAPRLMTQGSNMSAMSIVSYNDEISFQGSYHPMGKRASHITDEWSVYEESHRFTFDQDSDDEFDDDNQEEEDYYEDDDDEEADSDYDMARQPSDVETTIQDDDYGDDQSRITVNTVQTVVTDDEDDDDNDADGNGNGNDDDDDGDEDDGAGTANTQMFTRNNFFEQHMQQQNMSKNLVLSIKASVPYQNRYNTHNNNSNSSSGEAPVPSASGRNNNNNNNGGGTGGGIEYNETPLSDADSDMTDVMGRSPPSANEDAGGISEWTYKDVSTWLKEELLNDESISLNLLRKILLKFEMNYVSGNVLLVLDQEQLKKMGITKNDMIDKILALTQKLIDDQQQTPLTNDENFDEKENENDKEDSGSDIAPLPDKNETKFFEMNNRNRIDSLDLHKKK